MSLVVGVIAHRIAGGQGHMGGAGTTRAIAHFRPLRDVLFFASLAGPGAGSHRARKDDPLPVTTAREHLNRLVRHNGKAQMGVRGDTRWEPRQTLVAQHPHDVAEACHTDTRVKREGRMTLLIRSETTEK